MQAIVRHHVLPCDDSGDHVRVLLLCCLLLWATFKLLLLLLLHRALLPWALFSIAIGILGDTC